MSTRAYAVAVLAMVLATAPLTAQTPVDVTGTWTVSFSSSQGSVALDVELRQEGTALSGRSGTALGYRTAFGEGSVEGEAVTFDLDVEVDGEWYPVYFSGRLAEGVITGRVDIPDGTRANFTARRKEGS